jgi:hypothetical protein
MFSQAQANCLFFVDPCTSLQLTLETNVDLGDALAPVDSNSETVFVVI